MAITFDPRAQARKELNAMRALVVSPRRSFFARLFSR